MPNDLQLPWGRSAVQRLNPGTVNFEGVFVVRKKGVVQRVGIGNVRDHVHRIQRGSDVGDFTIAYAPVPPYHLLGIARFLTERLDPVEQPPGISTVSPLRCSIPR